jgi:hypothetical protein
MSNYVESKKTLDRIRNEYGCKGDVLFRTALQLVVSVGQCTVLDDGWYQCEVDDINAKHNKAEAERKMLFIARDFELAILECARELAEVDAYDLLIYVQKEVWLSGEGMDYQRAIELLKRCMEQIEANEDYDNAETYDVLQSIGFDDDELEEFGFEYLLKEE